jgi:hypothetical protein
LFFFKGVLEKWYDNDGHYSFIDADLFTACANPSTNAKKGSKTGKLLTILNESADEAVIVRDMNSVPCRLVSLEEGKLA